MVIAIEDLTALIRGTFASDGSNVNSESAVRGYH